MMVTMDRADVDALLVESFGGPRSQDDVLPFLRRTTAGRGVPDERLTTVCEQYRALGGVSPLNEENEALVRGLMAGAPATWAGERVYLGNRNSEPFLSETLRRMVADGVGRAAVFVTSAFSSYSGCRRYREDLADALSTASVEFRLDVLPRFFDHRLFAEIWVDRVVACWPGGNPLLVFVTHSLPVAMARGEGGMGGYLPQHEALAVSIASRVSTRLGTEARWELAFQSRSGPPGQRWLEPDVGDVVRAARRNGHDGCVVAPIGFCADNLEIAWDLDVVAARVAAGLGLRFVRLDPPQSDTRFVDLVWDLLDRYSGQLCGAACCPNPRGPRPAVGDSE